MSDEACYCLGDTHCPYLAGLLREAEVEVARLKAELEHERQNAATIESCGWRKERP